MDKDEQTLPLAQHREDEAEDYESLETIPQRRHERRRSPCSIIGIVIFCVILSTVSTFIGAILGRRAVELDRECAAHTTQYSPVLRDVDIAYAMKPFNGSFIQRNIYRRPASPEVDAAWEALGVDYRAGIIEASEGPASGLSSHHVQRAEKYGGGFLVNVEGMHHLHCLNLLRKSLYFNSDYYKALGHHAFSNDEDILQLHITHCLDAIRQVLMCNVDTGVLGQVWIDPKEPIAFPDFNTNHKCKNYDAVRQWAEKHQAPPVEELPPDYLAQPHWGDVYEATP